MEIRLSLWCCLIMLGMGCEKPIELDLDENISSIAVVSGFSNLDVIDLQLTRGQFILDASNQLDIVFDARVKLFRNDQFVEDLELVFDENTSIPLYRSSIVPQPNHEYEIQIEVPDQASKVIAKSLIPQPVELFSFSSDVPNSKIFINNQGQVVQEVSLELLLVFEDPAAESNFYHIKIFQDFYEYETTESGDTVITEVRRQELNFSPSINSNNVVASYDGGILFDDTQISGEPFIGRFPIVMSLLQERQQLGKTYVELRTASEDYYLYHTSLSRQIKNTNKPLAEPVILYDNIEEGIGIFAGYGAVMDSISLSN